MTVSCDIEEVDDLHALSTITSMTRQQWEADVVILASILALRCHQEVHIQGLPANDPSLEQNHLREAIEVPPAVANLLEKNVRLAKKMAKLIDLLGDSHPLAASLSRQHGDLRGGALKPMALLACASPCLFVGHAAFLPSFGFWRIWFGFCGPDCSFAGWGSCVLSHLPLLFMLESPVLVVVQQHVPAATH